MLTAFHMIGLSDLDTGRLGSPKAAQYLPEIVERARSRYEAIRVSGFLRPAQREATERRDEGHFFFEDQVSGDDQFVFLSVGRRYWQEPAQVNFGFLFDAEGLLDRGAILRKYDLLASYEDALAEIVESFAPSSNPDEWSAEEREKLLKALEEGASHEEYVSPNDAYYRLMDAVRELRYNEPFVDEIITAFRAKAEALQRKAQLEGQAALEFLRRSKDAQSGRHELLVPGRLALSEAIGFVEYGAIKEA